MQKWEATAKQKVQQAKEERDSHETNYQLGKANICAEIIKEIDKQLNEE